LPGAVMVPGSAEEMFRRRVEALPAESRRLLLLAAAEPTGDAVLLLRDRGQVLEHGGDPVRPGLPRVTRRDRLATVPFGKSKELSRTGSWFPSMDHSFSAAAVLPSAIERGSARWLDLTAPPWAGSR
jgi:hypothetical protein